MTDDEILADALRSCREDPNHLGVRKWAVSQLARAGRPLPADLFVPAYGEVGKSVPSREEMIARYRFVVWFAGDAPPVGMEIRRIRSDFTRGSIYRHPYRHPEPWNGQQRAYSVGTCIGWDQRVTYPAKHHGCVSCTCETVNTSIGFWMIDTGVQSPAPFRYHDVPPWQCEPMDDEVRRQLLKEQGRLCATCNGDTFLPAPRYVRGQETTQVSPCPECTMKQEHNGA